MLKTRKASAPVTLCELPGVAWSALQSSKETAFCFGGDSSLAVSLRPAVGREGRQDGPLLSISSAASDTPATGCAASEPRQVPAAGARTLQEG